MKECVCEYCGKTYLIEDEATDVGCCRECSIPMVGGPFDGQIAGHTSLSEINNEQRDNLSEAE